ncbi:hypothetical protein DRQ36_01725 [bacterium]|nr:MAG: hypothetical protein DRQ36_01725 [bacterium]
MKTRYIIIPFLALSFINCGHDKAEEKPTNERTSGEFTVFVTIQPLASIADSIAGNLANVEVLLPANSKTYDYKPTPDDIKRLANSAVLFEIGIGLDEWATPIALKAENGPRIVPVSAGIPILPSVPERVRRRLFEEGKVAAHGNPYVWLDPYTVADMIIPVMTRAFAAADPHNAGIFRENSAHYTERVKNFADEAENNLKKLKNSRIMLYHGSFAYFCRRYGIEVSDIIEPFPGREPTEDDIAEIIKNAKRDKPIAILVDSDAPPKPAETIAKELGIPIVHVDPYGKPGESYIELMRRNIRAIVEIPL